MNENHMAHNFSDRLKVWRQYWLPQHALSKFGGHVSHCRLPWLKNYLIQWFINRYQVNMDEALQTDLNAYPSFHDFFIRQLKPGTRPIDPQSDSICSPCDGAISQIGKIENGTLLQAKGRSFSLSALLGDAACAQKFHNGNFLTIYLAPKDYHRVHMPAKGALQSVRYIPGKLFSVNPLTTQSVDNLFARNERVISFFDHPQSPFAVILVGAMIVGSITTRWAGRLLPQANQLVREILYPQTPEQHLTLDKGEEMGYFSLGSTVIILFAENIRWEYTLTQDSRLVVGQRIGQFLP